MNDIAVAADDKWLSPPPRLVIALSAHAAREFIASGLADRVRQAQFLAVGRQTATVLEHEGMVVQVPDLESSEGLLRMPECNEVGAADSVWILAGEGGRDLLARYLRDVRHCRVVKFELYRRQSVDVGPFESTGIGAVVISSEQALEAFTWQWRAAHGSLDIPLIVPSDRVARAAAAMAFTSVHTAVDATAEATSAVVRRLAL